MQKDQSKGRDSATREQTVGGEGRKEGRKKRRGRERETPLLPAIHAKKTFVVPILRRLSPSLVVDTGEFIFVGYLSGEPVLLNLSGPPATHFKAPHLVTSSCTTLFSV